MTTEEKAKAYDEALEKARKRVATEPQDRTAILKDIFPQLRESEDERIRKDIIAFLQSMNGHCDPAQDWDLRNRWLPYLEKQKEMEMPDSTGLIELWDKEKAMLQEKDFRGDEWRLAQNAFLEGVARGYGIKRKEPNIEHIQRSWYMEGYSDGKFGKEPRWIIKTDDGGPRYKENLNYGEMVSTEETELNAIAFLEQLGYTCIPECGKKQAEWSEEDEKTLTSIIDHLNNSDLVGYDEFIGFEIWLKNLRPQPHWKPSEKQINMLGVIVEREKEKLLYGIDGYSPAAVLESLYNDLKKLMEE